MEQHSVDDIAGEFDALADALGAYSATAVADEFVALETAIDRIPSPDPLPKTSLQVQRRAGVEAAWQNYLRYFLDPTEPHGLGAAVLNRFLQGLRTEVSGNIPQYAPEQIEIIEEVRSAAGNQPDLVIQAPNRFFVCCELKLYSGEGQTQTDRYVEDPDIGQTPKSEFPDAGHHYVYIKRPGHQDAEAPGFQTITWAQIRDWLTPLVHEASGRYPARTTAQLQDFLDTIKQDMTDDPHQRAERKKMQLFFEHEAAIRQAEAAIETVHKYERDNWHRRFLDEYRPDTWSTEWQCNSNQYGQIYHTSWRKPDALENPDASIKLQFVHLIRDIESFTDGQLTMQLRWPGESAYRERFKELFDSEQYADQLDPLLEEYDIRKRADYSYANPRFTEKRYSVRKPDLPDSYYETLSVAVEEHQQLEPVITEMLDQAITDVDTST